MVHTSQSVVDPYNYDRSPNGSRPLNQAIWMEHLIGMTSKRKPTYSLVNLDGRDRLGIWCIPPCIQTTTGNLAVEVIP